MSTHCNVIIKVKPEDIGKSVKFSSRKLPVKLKLWNAFENTRSKCKSITIEKPYIGIFCHFDGYPSGVGNVLLEKFNDYDSILNLIAGGDCSSICCDSVIHYANRIGEKWNYVKPLQGDTANRCVIDYPEYVYIFEDGSWKYCDVDWVPCKKNKFTFSEIHQLKLEY